MAFDIFIIQHSQCKNLQLYLFDRIELNNPEYAFLLLIESLHAEFFAKLKDFIPGETRFQEFVGLIESVVPHHHRRRRELVQVDHELLQNPVVC